MADELLRAERMVVKATVICVYLVLLLYIRPRAGVRSYSVPIWGVVGVFWSKWRSLEVGWRPAWWAAYLH